MLRCVIAGLRAALFLALTSSAALAQVHRPFPAQALRGELLIQSPAEARLNGETARLAPGARIRGENNLLVMSGALLGQELVVHYTREPATGLLMDVWILNPVERANRPWPTTEAEARSWRFEPASQRWSRP